MGKMPTIEIENVISPGHRYKVDAAKYGAMRDAMLTVLPQGEPGLAVPAVKQSVLPLLPDDLFPGGAKAGWWLKAVQLDLEAKGIIRRMAGAPVRLFRAN